jgi:esterase/lipase superfamily enzyme
MPLPEWPLHNQTDKVQQVQTLDKSKFLEYLQGYSQNSEPVQEVLIYIHGFRKDFARSITNAAQLRHELAFPGPVIAFSWPSNKSITGYLSDLENVDWSEPKLRQLIITLVKSLPQAKIHIVAHSLGNRALIQSLIELREESDLVKKWPFGELVLLAPDFDKARFVEETSRHLQYIPSRITLYVSDRDFPLMTAAQVFQYPRLGDSREGPPILAGIETIDVSDAISITSGHGYYEESPIAIEDLYHLIHERMGASERPNMKEIKTPEGTYWRLQPAEAFED